LRPGGHDGRERQGKEYSRRQGALMRHSLAVKSMLLLFPGQFDHRHSAEKSIPPKNKLAYGPIGIVSFGEFRLGNVALFFLQPGRSLP
jgi:hypothetical protein